MIRKNSLIFLVIWLISCDQDLDQPIYPAYLEVDVPYVVVGSGNQLLLEPRALDGEGNRVDLEWEFYANNVQIDKWFMAEVPGEYNIWAKSGRSHTDTIMVEARADRHFEELTFDLIFHVFPHINVNLADIHKSVRIANVAFQGKMSSSNPNMASANISFRLAEKDPDGRLLNTPGVILHSDVPDKIEIGDPGLLPFEWNTDLYINIWITPGSGRSYATYPFVDCDHTMNGFSCLPENVNDIAMGIFMRPQHLGNTNTLVHELGHVFGLRHVFSDECDMDTDFCEDTPFYSNPGIYLSYAPKACDGQYFLQDNFMDYIGNGNTFTYDQVSRIRHVVEFGRYVGNKRGLKYEPSESPSVILMDSLSCRLL